MWLLKNFKTHFLISLPQTKFTKWNFHYSDFPTSHNTPTIPKKVYHVLHKIISAGKSTTVNNVWQILLITILFQKLSKNCFRVKQICSTIKIQLQLFKKNCICEIFLISVAICVVIKPRKNLIRPLEKVHTLVWHDAITC